MEEKHGWTGENKAGWGKKKKSSSAAAAVAAPATEPHDSHSTCSAAPPPPQPPPQRKRRFPTFSLRRLLYSSPLVVRRVSRSYSRHKHPPTGSEKATASTSRDVEKGETASGGIELSKTTSRVSVTSAVGAPTPTPAPGASTMSQEEKSHAECPLCLTELAVEYFPQLCTCSHRSCYDCLQQYLRIEISESRVCVNCPECPEPIHPNDIRMILNDKAVYDKYLDFMVRRVLAVEPDTRWCPAPDCGFAVIAAECASCPKLKCERPGCNSYFCYHCKAEWHPNQTCNAARAQRSPNLRSSSVSFSQDSQHNDIKPCPRCQVLIGKMDDGSCNHMTCAVCGAEFCWLCMKEVSDLHYLSPSGCTFWGKKPWSRKKKILWQLGTLVGAPVGIGLVAGIAIPAMIIGIPVWVGRKLYSRYENDNRHKRNLVIAGGVTASVLVSPVLAGLAVGIGVPILLFYVYGVVPVSLCRSGAGSCGVSTSATGVRFDFDDDNEMSNRNTDGVSMDAVSHRGTDGNPSIGEASLSLGVGSAGSGSHLERMGREASLSLYSGTGRDADHESASNIGVAGSIVSATHRLEVQADMASNQRSSLSSETASAATSLSDKSAADDGAASTRACAGSVLNYKAECQSLSSVGMAAAETADDDGLSCLEQLTSGLLKRVAANRRRLEKQGSDNSSCDDVSSERVRFDEHVSFIGAKDTWRPRDTVLDIGHGHDEDDDVRCGIVTEPKRAKRRIPTTAAAATAAATDSSDK